MDETLKTGLTLLFVFAALLFLVWAWCREDEREDAERRQQ